MAISDTITSIENHLTANYEGLENIGADLTNIDKNIENIRPVLDTIYSSLPKVTGENTEVTLNPTLKGKLNITEKGNSTQESTTGKNLLGLADGTYSNNGVTVVVSNGICTVNGTASGTAFVQISLIQNITFSSQNYVLSTNNASVNDNGCFFRVNIDGSNYIETQLINANASATKSANGTYVSAMLRVSSGTTFSNYIIKPQLELGTTATSYEQYTNGPAPNPNYSFPIKSVTGNNNVVVHSVNLFNKNDVMTGKAVISDGTFVNQTTYNCSNYIEVKPNTQYTLEPCVSHSQYQTLCQYDSNKNFVVYTYVRAETITFTTEANTKYIVFNYLVGNQDTVQLVQGNSVPTTYVPYSSISLPLNLGSIELNKIGNYQDYIYKNNDKWYKKEYIGKVTIGSSGGYNSGNNWYYINKSIFTNGINANELLSKYFTYVTYSDFFANTSLNGFCLNNSSYSYATHLVLRDTSCSSLANYQTLLNNIKPEAYYVYATPQDIEITDTNLISQLENIDKVKGYNGTTIITSTFDSSNAQMILSVSGLKGE